jgi:hypothetical protein
MRREVQSRSRGRRPDGRVLGLGLADRLGLAPHTCSLASCYASYTKFRAGSYIAQPGASGGLAGALNTFKAKSSNSQLNQPTSYTKIRTLPLCLLLALIFEAIQHREWV